MKKHILILFLFTSCTLGKFDIGESSSVQNDDEKNKFTQDSATNSLANTVIGIAEKRLHPIIESQEKISAIQESWGYGSGSAIGMGSAKAKHEIIYGQLISDPQLKIVRVNDTRTLKQSTDVCDGRIVYKIPDIMKVRSTYKALVRISKSKSTLSIYDSLKGTVITSEIPVTETMEVKLIDLSPKENPSFEIVDINSAVQIVDSLDIYTEWSWSVTPVRVGNSKLEIIVSVIRNNNRKDVVYEDIVQVQHDIIIQILFFIQTYWLALLSPVIIPLFLWFYNKKRKKKKR